MEIKKTKYERRKTIIYWKRSDDQWLFYLKKSYPAENYFLILPASLSKEDKIYGISQYLNIDPLWIEIERKFDRNRIKKYSKINY